jgi:hypothetical protein
MINFEFTKVYNGNDPRIFQCVLDIEDNFLIVKENEILRGGKMHCYQRYSINTVCSLQHDKNIQSKNTGVLKSYEKRIGDCLANM